MQVLLDERCMMLTKIELSNRALTESFKLKYDVSYILRQDEDVV